MILKLFPNFKHRINILICFFLCHATAATSILYPIFWILWEILYAPIRLALALASFMASVCGFISDLVGDIWRSLSTVIRLASASEATVSTHEVSIWRSLWNDLFSQVRRHYYNLINMSFFTFFFLIFFL